MAPSVDEAFESVTTSIASAYPKENLVRLRAPTIHGAASDNQLRTSMSDKLANKLARARLSSVEKVRSNAKAIELVVVMAALAALWVQCARRYNRYTVAYEKSWWPNHYLANVDSDTSMNVYWALLLCVSGAINCRYVFRFLCARCGEPGDLFERNALRGAVFVLLCLPVFLGSFIFSAATDDNAKHDYPRTLCSGATPLYVFLYRGSRGAAPRAEVFENYQRSDMPGSVFSLDTDASTTAFVLSLLGSDEPGSVAYDLSTGTATLPTFNLNATFSAVSNTSNFRMGPVRFQGLSTTLRLHVPPGSDLSRMSVSAVSGLGISRKVFRAGPYSPGDRSVLGACIARDEGQAAAMVLVPLGLALYCHDIEIPC